MSEDYCAACGELAELGRRSLCAACLRAPHQEKRRARLRLARSRARHSSLDWAATLAAWHFRCAYCGADLLALGEATKDHVRPLAGAPTDERVTDGPDNLVPACRACNSRKGAGPHHTP